MVKVRLPKVSANVEEETVTRWIKKEGERVVKGEPLVELTTEKASFDLESPCAGVLRTILAEEKSVLPVGYIIALVGGETDPLPDVSMANRKLLEKHRNVSARKGAKKPALKVSRDAVRATPAARRLAREKGLDLAVVAHATGADVVRENTLLKYIERVK